MVGLLKHIGVGLTDFLIYVIPINVLELLAAISGTIFIIKVPNLKPVDKYLVWFLWYVIFSELLGSISAIMYFSEGRLLPFFKDTIFIDNRWVINIYTLVSSAFYSYYFSEFLRKGIWKVIVQFLIVFYIISSIINLAVTDVFFTKDSIYLNLFGAFLIFLSIVLLYFEILKSEVLLNLKRFLPMYISIGILAFTLCVTPFTILSEYFNSENSTFVTLQSSLLLYSNLFMYSCFILGFYLCSKKKKYY